MKTELTQELVKKHIEYRDGKLFWKIPKKGMNKSINGDYPAGWDNGEGYIKLSFLNKSYYAHQIVFFMHYGTLPKFIDHIDGNKSNNKIENLRESTLQQNNCNKKINNINSKSKVRGVCPSKDGKKWLVKISHNNKTLHMGTFEDLELADLVAQEARNKYHGNFARHD